MTKKDEYFAMMEAQIRKWDAEVDRLRARSHEMSADARVKYDEQIRAMRAARDAAHGKLQELRAASETAWQHMQTGVDTAWASMKNALDKASSQFKKYTISGRSKPEPRYATRSLGRPFPRRMLPAAISTARIAGRMQR